MTKETKGGFQRSQQAKDRWVADLREEYGLPRDSSLEQIEAKATELLANALTAISGAELVLGRRVDARDQAVTRIIMMPGKSAEEKFGLLLMQKRVEDIQKTEG